jgi:hypothetical protein
MSLGRTFCTTCDMSGYMARNDHRLFLQQNNTSTIDGMNLLPLVKKKRSNKKVVYGVMTPFDVNRSGHFSQQILVVLGCISS